MHKIIISITNPVTHREEIGEFQSTVFRKATIDEVAHDVVEYLAEGHVRGEKEIGQPVPVNRLVLQVDKDMISGSIPKEWKKMAKEGCFCGCCFEIASLMLARIEELRKGDDSLLKSIRDVN